MIFRRIRIRLWYVIVFSVLMWGVVSWASFHIGRSYGHHETRKYWGELYGEIHDVGREAIYQCYEIFKQRKKEEKPCIGS